MRGDKVGGWGEVLVGGGEDAGVERGGDQIWCGIRVGEKGARDRVGKWRGRGMGLTYRCRC